MVEAKHQHDRYVSFCGLDCENRAQKLVERVVKTVVACEPDNPFWSLFKTKVEANEGPDALFLVHSYIFYMRELMEKYDDREGAQMLEQIETDCC